MATDRLSKQTLCPSAQPGADARVFGVVGGTTTEPRVSYLRETIELPADIETRLSPIAPSEVLRSASACQESRCVHFQSDRCSLVTRIVRFLPPVVRQPPPCAIRQSCRWWFEEGRAACVRCPQIVTQRPDANTAYQQAAAPAALRISTAAITPSPPTRREDANE